MAISQTLLSLAYYLPQFHEIDENNQWWGSGFTEWQQLRAAQQYYPWQEIRKPIAPYGEYSLLDPKVVEWQSSISKQHGIDGFIVFDYWFGNQKKLLDKPMQMVLDQKLNFDYCLCWANHSWYNKRKNITLQKQHYLGTEDYQNYFFHLLPHFKSAHYLKIDNRPIFSIFDPKKIPDLSDFINTFETLAKKAGFNGIYFIADNTDGNSSYANHFKGYTRSNHFFKKRRKNNLISYIKEKMTRKFGWNQLGPFCYSYPELVVNQHKDFHDANYIPTVFTGWDTTPRHLKRGTILTDFSVESFKAHLNKISQSINTNHNSTNGTQLIIIKSWNEWAEGNLLEPDNIFGYRLLEAYLAFIEALKKSRAP